MEEKIPEEEISTEEIIVQTSLDISGQGKEMTEGKDLIQDSAIPGPDIMLSFSF